MRRAIKVLKKQSGGDIIATVTLPFDERHRRRIRMRDDSGVDFLLDLKEAELLQHGDFLTLETGGYILVQASEEAVIDIFCSDNDQAARIAWHIGNRHVPLQVLPGPVLRILGDHVLADMVIGLGGVIEHRKAPFAPEGGAYAQSASGHGHGHSHNHGHNHPHKHGHSH